MTARQGTKMDIIRLKKEGKETPAVPVRRSAPVRKLVVRLLPSINEHLRREIRYRGDLSAMIIEAINTVDLERVPLVDLASDTRHGTTTVALPPPLHAQIKSIAKARNASMNEIVNTAVAHWLAGRNIIRLL
jgi:hypothetical protein